MKLFFAKENSLMESISEQLKQLTPEEMDGLTQLVQKYLEKVAVSRAKALEQSKNIIPVEKTVLFTYNNSAGELSERIVDVKQIIRTDKGWKLKGICHTRLTMRTFNAERIVDNRITNVETGEQTSLMEIFNLPDET